VLPALRCAQEAAAAEAAAATRELTETGSVVEEVMAKHPGPGHQRAPRLKVPFMLGCLGPLSMLEALAVAPISLCGQDYIGGDARQ
jgi:hypothetical protein